MRGFLRFIVGCAIALFVVLGSINFLGMIAGNEQAKWVTVFAGVIVVGLIIAMRKLRKPKEHDIESIDLGKIKGRR